MDCQTIFYISRTVEERKSVLCILRAHEGKDLAYVEIRCAGKTEDRKGDMTPKNGSRSLEDQDPMRSVSLLEKRR